MKIPETEVHVIESIEELSDLIDYVDNNIKEDFYNSVTLDTETDSASEKKARLFGIGFCFSPGQAFYVPIRKSDGSKWWEDAVEAYLKKNVEEWAKRLGVIGHNVLYDVLVIKNNWGLDLSEHVKSDTILLKHCIDEERPFGLKDVAVKYLGEWADQAQDDLKENVLAKGGKWTKDNKDMYLADTAILGKYCAWDVMLTRWLFDLFDPKIDEQELRPLFEEEVMPLYREVTMQMKNVGFPIDVPHFEKLKAELSSEILILEEAIQAEIAVDNAEFVTRLLNEDYPVKPTGKFVVELAEQLEVFLPTNHKTGKITLAAAAIRKLPPTELYSWILGEGPLPLEVTAREIKRVQAVLWTKENPTGHYIFNLASNHHLGWLFFEEYGLTPLSTTEGGKPQCDDDFLETVKDEFEWVNLLIDYKKLNKLLSTYVDGMLERHVDGVIYPSMLQFGTTSGRFACTNPNLLNLPRVKDEESDLSPMVLKYTNEIKKGFVAPKGFKIVNADYSALEPRIFSSVSEDPLLQEVFHKGLDFYSQIAIHTFGLTEYSADKKAPNYLGKKSPETRQKVKIFALAVAYGAEAGRIAKLMGITWQEANELIENYLEAFPGLRKYIERSHHFAKHKGFVKTQFGRIRHLPECMGIYKKYGDKILDYRWASSKGLSDVRRKYKHGLNNSTNNPIQGTAAHLMNRAMLAAAREFKRQNIEGAVVLNLYDELTTIVREDQAEQARLIIKDSMENTTKIAVPLIAEPVIGNNWAESK